MLKLPGAVLQVSSREDTVVKLLNICGVSSHGRPSNLSRPRILIVSSLLEAEFLSTCEVFQHLLQVELNVECAVVHGMYQMTSFKRFAYYLLVLLFRGIFLDQDFNKLLLSASTACPASRRTLEMVPVIADANFDYPGIGGLLKNCGSPGAHEEQVPPTLTLKFEEIRFFLPSLLHCLRDFNSGVQVYDRDLMISIDTYCIKGLEY